MKDPFDPYYAQFRQPEEAQALHFCNELVENIDEEHIFDWASQRLMYEDLMRLEGGNIALLLKRHPELDPILFASAVSKVAVAYWLDHGGVPANDSNLQNKMNY